MQLFIYMVDYVITSVFLVIFVGVCQIKLIFLSKKIRALSLFLLFLLSFYLKKSNLFLQCCLRCSLSLFLSLSLTPTHTHTHSHLHTHTHTLSLSFTSHILQLRLFPPFSPVSSFFPTPLFSYLRYLSISHLPLTNLFSSLTIHCCLYLILFYWLPCLSCPFFYLLYFLG